MLTYTAVLPIGESTVAFVSARCRASVPPRDRCCYRRVIIAPDGVAVVDLAGKSEWRRERLLDAALEVLVEKGIGGPAGMMLAVLAVPESLGDDLSRRPPLAFDRSQKLFRRGHAPDKVASAIVRSIERDRSVVPVGYEAWIAGGCTAPCRSAPIWPSASCR